MDTSAAQIPTNVAATAGQPRPLRVLVVDKMCVIAGNRQRYTRLAERANVDVTLLTPEVWVENIRRTPFEPALDEPITIVTGRVTWPGNEIKALYYTGLFKAIRTARPDVVFMMEEAFSFFALQVTMICRVLYPTAPLIFYANWILPYPELYFRPHALFRAVGRWVMNRTDAALCVNDRATRMLKDAGFDNAHTLFYGVDERLFDPVDQDAARRELGIPLEQERVFYAGRMRTEKGIEDLITAFARIVADRPDRPLHLALLGEGRHLEMLKSAAGKSGVGDRISFHSAVAIEQMPTIIGAATVLVLPTRNVWDEQFGRVAAEAMFVGTTVVGSTSGELPNVIGDGGYVFEAENVDALTDALATALDDRDESARRREIARRRALELFSMGAFVDGLIDRLESETGRPIRRSEGV